MYDDREGTAVGLSLSAGEVGNVVLPVVAGLVAGAVSWPTGFGLTVPLFALMASVLFRAVPGSLAREGVVDSLSLDTVRNLLRGIAERSILLVATIHLCLFFVHQGFTGFYLTYLVEAKGLSPTLAATLFGLFFSCGVIVRVLAGAAGDRFGTKRTLLAVNAVATAVLVAVPFVESLMAVELVTVVATNLVSVTPLTQPYLVNALSADMRESGLVLLRTVLIALGATGPVVRAVADRGPFDGAFLGLAVVATVALGPYAHPLVGSVTAASPDTKSF